MSVSAIAASADFNIALDASGDVYGWGANGEGELGNGTTTNSDLPVATLIPTGLQFSDIASGGTGTGSSAGLTSGTAPAFTRDTALPGETAAAVGAGAEPSIAIDHNGGRPSLNDMYVAAIGTASGFPDAWHSSDGGATWSLGVPYDNVSPPTGCSTTPGGDNDIGVLAQGDVAVDDLDITHAAVQVSHDDGHSFPATCTETAPEDDRPWETTRGSSTIYIAYHDFAAEVPVVCTSTDEGATFTCNQAFSSTTVSTGTHPGTSISECAENTIPARPLVVDPTNGYLNFMYSCSTTIQNVQDPPYGPLHDYYLAQSTDGGVTWNSTPVYIADTSGTKSPNLSGIFGELAVDASGNYYALFAGTLDDTHVLTNPWHVYLMTRERGSSTWSGPYQVDSDGGGTHVFPAMVATGDGNVDIIWESAYDPTTGSPATGEPNGVCGTFTQIASGMPQPCDDSTTNVGMSCENTTAYCPNGGGGPVKANWYVEMTQSTDAIHNPPSFIPTVRVTSSYMHQGEICVNGLVCSNPATGAPYSDRSLLDFISVAVDCTGDAHVTYAANPSGSTSSARAVVHEADQTSGDAITPPSTCSSNPVSTPEGPVALALPIAGVGVLGLVGLVRRRRMRLEAGVA